jgi:HTH-type transcriptional regulator/antitoxin HipB
MSNIRYKLRRLSDAGLAFKAAREELGLTATEVCRRAGRARMTLHRFESGEDISLSTLLSLLAAIGLGLDYVSAGMPTMAEMQRRFAEAGDDEGDDG